MGLEQVLQEIESRSQQARQKLEAEAQAARAEALAAGNVAVDEHRKKALERASREIVRMQTQEAASTELELKREELQMERELLDRVVRLAEEKLKALPRERNEAILKSLLSHYGREGTQVLALPKDELFLKMASKLRMAGPINGTGGIVVTNADGTVRVDLTYETLLRDVSDKSLKDVHSKLFGHSA
jgi:V/A-type H+-transporting ATPase subunit E